MRPGAIPDLLLFLPNLLYITEYSMIAVLYVTRARVPLWLAYPHLINVPIDVTPTLHARSAISIYYAFFSFFDCFVGRICYAHSIELTGNRRVYNAPSQRYG
ncbi:hypothetical protein B0H67DRAFT_559159 [Lasiosphaeris hirsuta]|uniref:Uncharacterized protein n=1 Tax=Lasiosphaeris hirsuta TaxID=260670 RepID=A0AA40EBS6_9PEZI|nr:hypothetical protein B0H67DRAFT_559159 [Lasiosphaeris hirsuta]